MVTRKTTVQQYTEDKQSWTDYLDEMVDAIDCGLMDDILKPMAQALFARRDEIDPTWRERAKKASVENRASIPAFPPPDTHVTPLPPMPAVPNAAAYIRPRTVYPVAPANDGSTFYYAGNHYSRNDVFGKELTLAADARPKSLAGLRIRVTGIKTKVKVVILEEPRVPQSSSWWKAWSNQDPIFIPITFISHVFVA